MRAGQQVHPHKWVALAKRVHLLEALALHHRNIETACRVVIANLKLILFLCVLFDFLIYPCTQFTLKSDYHCKKNSPCSEFCPSYFQTWPACLQTSLTPWWEALAALAPTAAASGLRNAENTKIRMFVHESAQLPHPLHILLMHTHSLFSSVLLCFLSLRTLSVKSG